MSGPDLDVAILGGGLAGGLIALALARRRPEVRVALIEAEGRLGGNHIWSCFPSDIAEGDRWLTAPLICHAWDGHSVRFADHQRDLAEGYQSIESERLDAHLREALHADSIFIGTAAKSVTPTSVQLADGRKLAARAVIDARGPGDLSRLRLGYQKFLGQLLTLDAPHGLTRPIVMDADVDQSDGYRFVYVLPFGPCELFVEDTYYSSDPALDEAHLAGRIADYATAHGWTVTATSRSETGVLPVCMDGDFEAYWQSGAPGIGKAGMRGAFFHAMTGYSLADAVRVASMVARQADLSGAALYASLHKAAEAHWCGQRFYRLLATMLFEAADPPERHRILSRFYRLSPSLIARFYGGRSTLYDKLRILAGKPPVPLGRAIVALGARIR